MSSARKDAIRAALDAIAQRHGGRVTAEAVVKAAKTNRKGPLGRTFRWDVRAAAEQHWLDHARDLIARYLTIEVIVRSETIVCPMYVRDPAAKTNEGGYVAITSADLERENARQIVLAEIERCRSAINRGRAVADVLDSRFPGLSGEFEDMLIKLTELRGRLSRAA